MSGLLFLTSDDFTIQQGVKGPILATNIQGYSLILFYSTQCKHCQSLIPIFKQLPGSIGGCQFGMINVSQNKQCIMMSRNTVAPIKVVPYIILYIGGRPYMRYNGPHDPKEIGRFIIEVVHKLQSQTSNNTNEKIKETKGGIIPEYTTGHPLCGPDNKVCYLDYDDAYSSDKTGPNNKTRRPQQVLPAQAGMNSR
jgi:thiol-disulfide isomerase/thioredoxin